ncbi:MAG: PorT family protein [Bacteroides sp.]|nr:PorT family protein [Bacteroides sp.]
MRKFISLIMFALLGATTVQAQSDFLLNEDNYIGIRLGFNMNNLSMSGMDVDKSLLTGMNVGVVYGISLNSEMPLFFEPGLLVSSKGVKIDATREQGEIRSRLTYLEIPFVFKYKYDELSNDISIQPFFGGFMAVGVGGKTKYFDTREKLSSFRSDAFRKFDAGLRFGCGVAYQNLYIDFSYDWGLANIACNKFSEFGYDNFDDAIRTRCFSLTVGIDF